MLIPVTRIQKKINPAGPIRLAILGSTGSIGTSALEVVRAHRDLFEIKALCAGKNTELLANQVKEFGVPMATCTAESGAKDLRANLGSQVEINFGEEALVEAATRNDVDIVLAAVVGVAGLVPVVSALRAGKKVALANKEALVAGGEFVAAAAREFGGQIIPVDSEHSALFQALQGESPEDIAALILTASGGPFLFNGANLDSITPQEAVRHPRWQMGAKVSIDSATLMNKALELIEAHWLFGVPESRIEVLVHPQSIVHSLVRFVDGAEVAQLSTPDMKGPISYALFYPCGRYPRIMQQLSLAAVGRLDFLALDKERFSAVELAREAIRHGKSAAAALNVGNEIAVERFSQGALRFTEIVPFAAEVMNRFGDRKLSALEDLSHLIDEIHLNAQRAKAI